MNVSEFILEQSKIRPYSVAVKAQKKSLFNFLKIGSMKYETLTFLELEQRANHYAKALYAQGLRRGDRVLLFVRPGIEFPVIIFSLFKAGFIPIFIDPGMGVDSMLQCIEKSGARGLIGIAKIHHLKILKPSAFASVELSFVVQGRTLGVISLERLIKGVVNETICEQFCATDCAAILYTSGGTGTPKGVIYTHEMFMNQIKKLKQLFKLTPEDRDYPCFPLFGLFSLSLGMTVIMPEVDLLKPSKVNGKALVKGLLKHGITFTTGSPALWSNVAKYAVRKKITLPRLKTIATFGAPVSLKLHRELSLVVTSGDVYTPYGATECLPVSCISSREVLNDTRKLTLSGMGTCVGYPAYGVEIKILSFDSHNYCALGAVGEILVSSNTATPGYDHDVEGSAEARWVEPLTKKVFHKMGDVGYVDQWDRLWFLGRKAHMISRGEIKIFTEEIEPIVNEHAQVLRSALVESQKDIVLVIERLDGRIDLADHEYQKFTNEIKTLIASSPKAAMVDRIELYIDFPLDTRHNIKIDRQKLGKLIAKSTVLGLS